MKKTFLLLCLVVLGCASGTRNSTAKREVSQYVPPYGEEGIIKDSVYFFRDLVERVRGFPEDENVDINTVRGTFEQTFLHEAAASDDPNVVEDLLRRGADANARDEFDRTPLHIAVIRFQARPSLAVRRMNSAISRQIIGLLIDQGQSNVNAKDRYGNVPLHYFARLNYLQYSNHREVFHDVMLLFIENGAEIDVTNSQNETPLYYAAQEGNVRLVRSFIEDYGADPHLGESVLDAVRVSRNRTAARRQFASRLDSETRDDHGVAAARRKAIARVEQFNLEYPPDSNYLSIISILRGHGVE